MNKFFLDTSIGYSMNMGGLLLKRELIACFKRNGYDVTPEQWAILSRLNESDDINQNELAEKTFKDNANITRIIHKLITKKLADKIQDKMDGRASKIYLTKSGRNMVLKLQPLALEVLKKATRGLTKDQVETVNNLMHKIIHNLQH